MKSQSVNLSVWTDDGHTFEFTHLEPGYKEQTIVDGVKQ